MKISTLVNFKLNNGTILLKGTYDDSEKDFPDELMDEIKKARDPKNVKKKIIILVDEKKRKVPAQNSIPVEPEEEINTIEDDEEVITTEVKKPVRSRKIRK